MIKSFAVIILKKQSTYKAAYKAAFPHTIPVMTGYLFIGIAFGVMFADKGYNFLWAGLMSLLVYAGSGQYLAVNFFEPSVSLLQVVFLTFMVNVRHIFYGLSLLDKFKASEKKKPYMVFSLTDETYSLVCGDNPKIEPEQRTNYCFFVSLFDHIYWVLGCSLGNIATKLLPISFEGVEFVLTALFVTMFVDRWLTNKDHFPAMVGVCATFVSLLLFGSEFFLIPAMVLIALLLTLSPKTGRRDSNA